MRHAFGVAVTMLALFAHVYTSKSEAQTDESLIDLMMKLDPQEMGRRDAEAAYNERLNMIEEGRTKMRSYVSDEDKRLMESLMLKLMEADQGNTQSNETGAIIAGDWEGQFSSKKSKCVDRLQNLLKEFSKYSVKHLYDYRQKREYVVVATPTGSFMGEALRGVAFLVAAIRPKRIPCGTEPPGAFQQVDSTITHTNTSANSADVTLKMEVSECGAPTDNYQCSVEARGKFRKVSN